MIVDNNFFNKISVSLILFYLIDQYTRIPQAIKLSLLFLLFAGSVYDSAMYQLFKRKVIELSKPSSNFEKEKYELLTTIRDLSQYETRTKNWNQTRQDNAKTLTWKQQAQLKNIGYFNRITKINAAIKTNQKMLNACIEFLKDRYALTYTDLQTPAAETNPAATNYRVIESLCHYQRDWTSMGEVEILPIIEYIKKQCLAKCDQSTMDFKKTMVILPGSGLGRVAHELASDSDFGFKRVQSIEYSMLMKCLNEFVYSDPPQKEEEQQQQQSSYKFHPYLHNYSNQVNSTNQLRSLELHTLGETGKPQNLDIKYGDFTKFDLSHVCESGTAVRDEYENIIFVTVFFMDTAENLFKYIETINKLASQFPGKARWINVGPLKYGTRPKVELTLQELQKLIEASGWQITDSQKPKLLGYLTDLESMWQGQYGVSLFACNKI